MLQTIESALELPAPDHDGHLIHTPNGPALARAAHVSHLPVQAAIPESSLLGAMIVGHDDDGHEAHGADPHAHTDDPHAHTDDPHAEPAAPAEPVTPATPADPHATDPHATPADPHEAPADPHEAPADPAVPVPAPHPDPASPPAPPHSEMPEPGPEAPYNRDGRVMPGYEDAHPAKLNEEKYAYLNGLASFAIGPGIFFLGLLVVSTFGLFVYAYKNDPRVF